MQGNPLAINYAEWLALSRYLIPSIKYWVFEQPNYAWNTWSEEVGSDELLQNSEKLVELVARTESPVFTLGLPSLSQD